MMTKDDCLRVTFDRRRENRCVYCVYLSTFFDIWRVEAYLISKETEESIVEEEGRWKIVKSL